MDIKVALLTIETLFTCIQDTFWVQCQMVSKQCLASPWNLLQKIGQDQICEITFVMQYVLYHLKKNLVLCMLPFWIRKMLLIHQGNT